MMNVTVKPETAPKLLIGALVLGGIVLAGGLNSLAEPGGSLGVLCLVPVGIASWVAGENVGGAAAAVAVLIGLYNDLQSGAGYIPFSPYANAAVNCFMFMAVVTLVLLVKKRLEALNRAATDATRELAAEQKTHASARKALQMICFTAEHLAHAVYWYATDGRIWQVNAAACRMLGYSREELLSMKIPEVCVHFPVDSWESHMKRLMHETHVCFESVHRRKDGEEIPVEVTVTYFMYEGAKYNCSLVRDITERKKAEAERRNLMHQLAQSQKLESIGRLAGGIAHDFNNLLTPIIGCASLLKHNRANNDQEREMIEAILQAAEKARTLTQQVLTFGRKQEVEMTKVDLNDVVRSFHEILRSTLKKGIEVRLSLTPLCCGILAAESQLDQIIMNLAVNAQDAIETGGTIFIKTERVLLDNGGAPSGEWAMLAVTDTGCGMDRETLARIFEPFFTTKEVGHGTGLGLSTLYGIVKQHGGDIRVESEPGHGSTFRVYFPLDRDLSAARETAHPEPSRIRGGSTTNELHLNR